MHYRRLLVAMAIFSLVALTAIGRGGTTTENERRLEHWGRVEVNNPRTSCISSTGCGPTTIRDGR